jgi:hypothetical protein
MYIAQANLVAASSQIVEQAAHKAESVVDNIDSVVRFAGAAHIAAVAHTAAAFAFAAQAVAPAVIPASVLAHSLDLVAVSVAASQRCDYFPQTLVALSVAVVVVAAV